MKKVLITGILGQDGANMAEYLIHTLPDPIYVIGVTRRSTNPNLANIEKVKDSPLFSLRYGDITDTTSIDNLVREEQPDFFINFAADSFVGNSWNTPGHMLNVNAGGVLNCLEAIRKFAPECKFYSAGSSEEFGEIQYVPQDENHKVTPVSPYSVAKTTARHLVSLYRESHKLFAIHGTLYNHEGPKRGSDFVTRKITRNVVKVAKSLKEPNSVVHTFKLGNVYAKKDWSDSRDMVRGIWMMVNAKAPKEYILASGKSRTVAEFVEVAFEQAGLVGRWVTGEDPLKDYFEVDWEGATYIVLTIDPKFFRLTEVGEQVGDYSKAKEELGWFPQISFDTMVAEMLKADERTIS